MTRVTIGPADGSLTVRTDVAGPAARMGHRLLLTFDDWAGLVTVAEELPTSLRVDVELASLRVLSGTGGATPLSPVDKQVIKYNATKSLGVAEHPRGTFTSDRIEAADGELHIPGHLMIAGENRPLTLAFTAVRQGSAYTVAGGAALRQSDFGVDPYSLLRGALRVADEVEVRVDLSLQVP